MNRLNKILLNRTSATGFLLLFFVAGNISQIFAHGGEDHGDAKPKTETTDKGTVSHQSGDNAKRHRHLSVCRQAAENTLTSKEFALWENAGKFSDMIWRQQYVLHQR